MNERKTELEKIKKEIEVEEAARKVRIDEQIAKLQNRITDMVKTTNALFDVVDALGCVIERRKDLYQGNQQDAYHITIDNGVICSYSASDKFAALYSKEGKFEFKACYSLKEWRPVDENNADENKQIISCLTRMANHLCDMYDYSVEIYNKVYEEYKNRLENIKNDAKY